MLGDLAERLAGFGVAGIVFVVACSSAAAGGLAGAAVVTSALAAVSLGTGMVGGIFMLGAIATLGLPILRILRTHGLEALLFAVYNVRKKRGESLGKLCGEIDTLWIPDTMRRSLKTKLGCN